MSRVRIKICGITRENDALAAVEAGVDALGFVFYEVSPRYIAPDLAGRIIRSLPPFVTAVGLFVNPRPGYVNAVLDQVPLGLLQFHGDETPEDCAHYGRPYIKALRVNESQDVLAEMARYTDASGFLLDAWHPELRGGTGTCFDWQRFPAGSDRPLILAGGLTPDNVAEAVRLTQPYAVDVSGGVEARKGIKDPQLIKAFVEGVRRG